MVAKAARAIAAMMPRMLASPFMVEHAVES
jgi:hypothetical protein